MPEQPRKSRLLIYGALIFAGLVVVAGGHAELKAAASDNSVPVPQSRKEISSVVDVIRPKLAEADNLTLPGRVEAIEMVQIRPRVSGYIAETYVDIGDSVRSGDLLLRLDTPELAQQLAQAEADHASALAKLRLADASANRWKEMLRKDAVSRQEADERSAEAEVARAFAAAAKANVARLRSMLNFARITAPFDAVVTGRSAQTGALVNAGVGGEPPLFILSDARDLRLIVHVPQMLFNQVRREGSVKVLFPDRPAGEITAEYARSTGAVDPETGAVLVEFQIENPDLFIRPGAYAEVKLSVSAQSGMLTVPAGSIVYGPDGVSVFVVDGTNTASQRAVRIGRDNGVDVEIVSGLLEDDLVIRTPPEILIDGDQVRVVGSGVSRNEQ